MPEYTFTLGDVNYRPGLYFSWIIRAASEEEAVRSSRQLFEGDEPLELGHDEEDGNFYGLVLRANPDEIGPENIIDIHDPVNTSPDSRLQGR